MVYVFRDFDNGYLENITSLGFTFNELGGIENVPIRREHIDQKQSSLKQNCFFFVLYLCPKLHNLFHSNTM